MNGMRLTRRAALIGGAAAVVTARRVEAAEFTVGFIYVGSRTDYGYNQAHAEGAAAVRAMPDVKVVEQAKVPETVA